MTRNSYKGMLGADEWDTGGRGHPKLWVPRCGFSQLFVLIEGSGTHYSWLPRTMHELGDGR